MSADASDVAVPQAGGLSRASAHAVLVNVFGSGMRLGLQVLLARTLGVAGYGQFTLARAWGELLSRLPNSGFEASAVKELPRADLLGLPSTFRGFVRAAWRTTATRAIVLSAGAITAYLIATRHPDLAIVLGLLLTGPLALAQLARALLQGHHRFVTGSALIEIVQPIAFALAIATLWLVDRLTVVTALFSWIGTLAIAAIAGAIVLRRGYGPELARAVPEETQDKWQGVRRPLYASQLAFIVLDNVDILLVGALLDRTDVAIYAVATRLAVLGRILLAGVQSVAASHLAAAAATQDWIASQRIVDRSLRLCALPGVAITLLTAAFAGPLVEVFGDGYGESSAILRVLLIGNLVNSVTGPSGYLVSLSGLEHIYARIMWAAAVGTIVFVSLGILLLGAIGAAWAVTAVTTGWNIALLVIAKRRLGICCWVRPATFRALEPRTNR